MEIIIFQLLVLIFSAIVHEVAHGMTAERLGDPTARLMGRLTFNPLRHLDPFGSFILPALLYFVSQGGFVFGYAKPVPYNPVNLKNPNRDAGLIAVAGPISNLLVAVIFGLLYRFAAPLFYSLSLAALLAPLFGIIVLINISLAVFNLVPLPPLDGSKVIAALLPTKLVAANIFLERYGVILFLLFIFFGFRFITPIISFLFRVITG